MSENRRTSSTAGTGDIRCPFFVAHNDYQIVCEGLVDSCRSIMRFRNTAGKKFHQETYCEKGYKRCEMYLSIMHWRWDD